MKLVAKDIKKFQAFIFSWWKMHKRDLSWRHTHDPYKILVSEVMLQQTQVSRVLPKYEEFLTAFPTVYALAKASPAEVLKVWKGMGYNRRALYLHRTAKEIIAKYQGKFPKTEKELVQLPGLGIYTARALLVFAYKENVAMIDTNIRQIITHFFFDDIAQKASVIADVADQLLPKGKSWEWHQALMDYGAIALNVSRITSHVSQKKSVPFRESNRFYRGRIMDRLREGDISQRDLLKEFTGTYGKSEDFIASILSGLEADGLISRSKTDIIGLPK